MTHEKLALIGFGIVFVAAVLKVLETMLSAGATLAGSLAIFTMYLALPAMFFALLTSSKASGWMLFLLLVLDVQVYFRMSPVSAIYPFYCLCLAAHFFRALLRKEPLLPPGMASLPWLAYFAVAMVRYFRDPALPTFGLGAGSGFRAYFQFFTGFAPYLVLPALVDRGTLARMPRMLLWVSCAATVLRLVVASVPNDFLQALLFTAPQMSFMMAGRFSLLTLSSTCLFVSAAAMLFFGGRSRSPAAALIAAPMLALASVGLLLTGTRALTLAAVGTILYIMLVKRWWLRAVLTFLLLAAVGTYVANMRLSVGSPLEPVVRALTVRILGSESSWVSSNPYVSTETLEWRTMLWSRVLSSVAAHPWLGRGFSGRFSEFTQGSFYDYEEYVDAVTEGELDAGAAHSLFLAPALSFGLPAGLLFVAYVLHRAWWLLRLILRLRPEHELFLAAHTLATWMVFILVSGITSGGSVATPLLLVLALSHLLQTQLREPPPTAAAAA
jgi:hypothetical protein